MSDHEVNIKILMDILVRRRWSPRAGTSATAILPEMTDEVAELVLADNANQARALTLDGVRSVARYETFVGLIEEMVAAGSSAAPTTRCPTREELLASPHRGARPAAAAAGRAARPHQDARLRR